MLTEMYIAHMIHDEVQFRKAHNDAAQICFSLLNEFADEQDCSRA